MLQLQLGGGNPDDVMMMVVVVWCENKHLIG